MNKKPKSLRDRVNAAKSLKALDALATELEGYQYISKNSKVRAERAILDRTAFLKEKNAEAAKKKKEQKALANA